jgi:Fe-S-cluster-containing dehydrogenase component
MQYGFVIDHESCIGCHACTVACKAENDVPVGAFRTWVKYTEQGVFPDTKRHFLVERCNHCTDAPCVTICPVNALEKRPDGIVDVDRDACIGCRACMQACPYDAIYLNGDLGAVEKCHFCAHRVDRGLEPACVTVCPVGAIIPGDLHDPESKVSLLVRNNQMKVRRAEQRTGPNVHYVGADDLSLRPGAAARPSTYLWSERPPHKADPWPVSLPLAPEARVVLDAGHRVEWGMKVALYLVTKAIAAGAAMLAPFAVIFGMSGFSGRYLPEVLALVFSIITVGLLIEDLAKPLRFYRLLTRPNWQSWLVKGGVILGVFGAFVCATILARWSGLTGVADGMRWIGAALGIAAAGYTAFLFGQCKGRDLWESRLLLPHLLVQAVMCGGACFLLRASSSWPLRIIVAAAILAHGALAVLERARGHETENARQAAAFLGTIRIGPISPYREGLLIGVLLALLCVFILPSVTLIPLLIGLVLYEHAYIRAGQLPPLS